MRAVVTDLDSCYVEEDTNVLEDSSRAVIDRITNDSLSSGTKILKELAGISSDYIEREDVREYLEEADSTYLVTGRPDWPRIGDRTRELIEGFDHSFDDAYLYPGSSMEDEDVETGLGWYELFTGGGIPEYKRAVVEELGEQYDEVVFIDDSEECHRAVEDLEYVTGLDEQLSPALQEQ